MKRKTFRHKLNMLELGLVMLRFAGGFAALGALCLLSGWRTAAKIAFLLAAAIFAVLLVLVRIELYQDDMLDRQALEENRKKGIQ